MSTRHRNVEGSDLQTLVNVGPAVAGRFERVGITRTGQLVGRDPVALYEEMCEAVGQREDLCLLDTVMSAVDQADGGVARPWWEHTGDRKRLLAKRDGESRD